MNKTFGLNEAASALGIIPMNASNWLAGMGLTSGNPKGKRLYLDRSMCLALLLCNRLSFLRRLDFEDGEIQTLLRYVLFADPDLEADLRLSKVALSLEIGGAREVAISSHENDVLRRHQAPFHGGVKWILDAIATVHLCLSTFALGPLYDLVDEMFLEEAELAEKKDPWLKFGVPSEVK